MLGSSKAVLINFRVFWMTIGIRVKDSEVETLKCRKCEHRNLERTQNVSRMSQPLAKPPDATAIASDE